MAVPKQMECAIAQDLLVPYVAGDVRPETRAFVEAHVSRCTPCHTALAETAEAAGATVQVPPPALPADPGQKVVSRVRRNILVLVGVLVLCVALTAGSVVFGISALRKLTGMPAEPPVPNAGLEPAAAAELVSLARLGLTAMSPTPIPNGVQVVYLKDDEVITLTFQQFDTYSDGSRAFHRWNDQYRVRMLSAEFNTTRSNSARFRSGGNYYYGWNRGLWLVTMEVPGAVTEPAQLRDQIYVALSAAFPAVPYEPR